MHILPEKGESTSHNSPIACVELRFLNSILDTFELDPLTVLNITPFEGITDIWSKWGAVLMSPYVTHLFDTLILFSLAQHPTYS